MLLDIGVRLREERERLSLSQAALGEIGGIKKLAQLKYEQGARAPDAVYLALIARVGIDVQYIVTGERASTAIPKDELELVELYRSAPLAVKAAAQRVLTTGDNVERAQVFHGKVGNVVQGDMTNNAPITFDLGSKKKR
uniref:helix-turn-helix domain-containing protein n=1 Tax=Serratia quinivorans TaxID=137545 RepID=UPI0035C6E68E